jgi:hypothetical protein
MGRKRGSHVEVDLVIRHGMRILLGELSGVFIDGNECFPAANLLKQGVELVLVRFRGLGVEWNQARLFSALHMSEEALVNGGL